jgi:nitroreductase
MGVLKDLAMRTRSCRRFREDVPVERDTLLSLVDLARLAPSGGDRQALKYALSHETQSNHLIFPHLTWAVRSGRDSGPAEGERPSAYILVLCDHAAAPNCGCDHGFACQNICLGATERGLGSCAIGSIQRGPLALALGLPERFEILLVIALGLPLERFAVDPAPAGSELRHWWDDAGVHHVPKRTIEELIVTLASDPPSGR